MKNSAELKFHNNKIMIDNEIIYDFEDRYHNISALSVEQQVQFFSRLVNSISATNLSAAEKNEFILICACLFKVLSAKNTPASVLIIGNNYFLDILAEIINLFSNENKLYHICDINNYHGNSNCNNVISIVVSTFSGPGFLAGNNFAAVLIDHNFIKNNIHSVLSECIRLLTVNGAIICYGSDFFSSESLNIPFDANTHLYQLDTERFVVSVSINDITDDTSHNSAKEEIINKIGQEGAKLLENLQYIMSNRPASPDDIWYSIIDECIYVIDQIESIIMKNYMLFENQDLKYQTNEVKNALLDFKYEAYLNRKYYDFFQSNLFDCYNDWVTNIR